MTGCNVNWAAYRRMHWCWFFTSTHSALQQTVSKLPHQSQSLHYCYILTVTIEKMILCYRPTKLLLWCGVAELCWNSQPCANRIPHCGWIHWCRCVSSCNYACWPGVISCKFYVHHVCNTCMQCPANACLSRVWIRCTCWMVSDMWLTVMSFVLIQHALCIWKR